MQNMEIQAVVKIRNNFSEKLEIRNELKQREAIPPPLFNIELEIVIQKSK